MARIRTIKPEFWVSEQIAECSTNARLTFIGLWNFCDDNGVHPAKPKTLKAELFPMDDFSATDVANWMEELIRTGLVCEFHSGDAVYWQVTGWAKHQKIDRPSFKYPTPPDTNSASTPRHFADDSPSARRAPPPGVEGNGVRGNGVDVAASPKAPLSDPVRGMRLASDWSLPAEWRAWAEADRPDLDPVKTAERFKDHWLAQPGAKGRKSDWQATWRNWVRNERLPVGQRAMARPSTLSSDEIF